MSDRPSID